LLEGRRDWQRWLQERHDFMETESVDGVKYAGNDSGEMAFQLLADWWMNTIQALVDSSGSSGAVSLLRPHHVNAAIAACMNLKNVLGVREGDPNAAWFLAKVGIHFFTRRDALQVELKEGGIVGRVSDCPYKNGPMELCKSFCGIAPNVYAETLSPSGAGTPTVLLTSLTHGDPECIWVWRRSPRDGPFGPDDLGETKAMIVNMDFPKEVVDSYSIQYLGEFWIMGTRALNDHLGPGRSPSILGPYMRHSGISFGLRHMSSHHSCAPGVDTIVSAISSCNEALQMIHENLESSRVGSSVTITDCPFKDAPPEVCAQFESFCNGICEGIDPRYKFAYDRMMSRGDSTCHWKLWRGDGDAALGATDEPSDLKAQLKKRLVSGELSIDEYDKILERLKDA
jgi:hypothetical protein